MGRIIPHQDYGCIFQHFGRFGTPDVIHTLLRVITVVARRTFLRHKTNIHSSVHLRAMRFGARVHDKWSYEQLPMVQRIMNTVEKTSTGVTPVELILDTIVEVA